MTGSRAPRRKPTSVPAARRHPTPVSSPAGRTTFGGQLYDKRRLAAVTTADVSGRSDGFRHQLDPALDGSGAWSWPAVPRREVVGELLALPSASPASPAGDRPARVVHGRKGTHRGRLVYLLSISLEQTADQLGR